MNLEESLSAFERGVALTRTCQKALDAAEQRVRILTESQVDAEPEPFAPTAGESR
jgi:exodeoxyribonuclease VII small subunit